jgi:transposase
MRQPTSPLHALIAAVPDNRLRELVLELLQNGAAQTAPPATEVRRRRRGWPKGKPRGRRGSTRAHQGLPPKARAAQAIAVHPEKTNRAIADEIGVSEQTVMRARAEAKAAAKAAAPARRGKPRALRSGGRRGPGRPRKAIDPGLDVKILAKRKREAERLRVKRAAAKLAKAAKTKTGTNGNAEASASATPTQAFWQHAEMLQPTGPWKAVAAEFGINLAQAKDCYRKAILPPGMSSGAVEKFLELPA